MKLLYQTECQCSLCICKSLLCGNKTVVFAVVFNVYMASQGTLLEIKSYLLCMH